MPLLIEKNYMRMFEEAARVTRAEFTEQLKALNEKPDQTVAERARANALRLALDEPHAD